MSNAGATAARRAPGTANGTRTLPTTKEGEVVRTATDTNASYTSPPLETPQQEYPAVLTFNITPLCGRCAPGGVHRGGGFDCGSNQLKPSPMPHSLGTFLAAQESTAPGRENENDHTFSLARKYAKSPRGTFRRFPGPLPRPKGESARADSANKLFLPLPPYGIPL